MYYPLFVHDQAAEPIIPHHNTCTFICHIWITITICACSFYDLIIAYSSSPCYTTDIPASPLSIHIWLYISGYVGFAHLLLNALYHSYRDTSDYRRSIIISYDVCILLVFTWNILGTIVLWVHYSDYVSCSLEIAIYMGSRISIGIIINFLQLYMNYRQL